MRGPHPRAKDTGLRNLPLKGFARNQIWCEIAALACELLAWTQMLALTGPARRREPSACSQPRAAWPAAGASSGCGSPSAGPGLRSSPPQPPVCRPCHPAYLPQQHPRPGRRTTRARGTPPTQRDSRAARHGHTPKSTPAEHLRPPQPGHERSRLEIHQSVVKAPRTAGPRQSCRELGLGASCATLPG